MKGEYMTAWIRSFRLPVVILAVLLTVVSFKISDQIDSVLLPALTVAITAIGYMLQNDWRDRFHDMKKGKFLASRAPKQFLALTITVWIAALVCTALMWKQDYRLSWLPISVIMLGLVHPETRHFFLLPQITTSLITASTVLFPMFLGRGSETLWLLFTSVALIIFSREIIKDLDDMHIDKGYKRTLPLAIGGQNAATVAVGILAMSSFALLALPHLFFIGIPFLLASAICLLMKMGHAIAKIILDAGMGTTLVFILLVN